ncbi:response regulator [Bosea sp. 2RAB26]|uniref:response regulator n=1 Tax=Bosea sp. 2RAB26 TaxID=3237476 RepID=UPI003F9113F9
MSTRHRPKKSVLVLEDEPIVALDIEGILSDAGYDVPVTLATNAKAMDWLTSNIPDMVVLDIDLSDGSSVEVAHRLRARAIPFIVFTGTSASETSVPSSMLEDGWRSRRQPTASSKLSSRCSRMTRYRTLAHNRPVFRTKSRPETVPQPFRARGSRGA